MTPNLGRRRRAFARSVRFEILVAEIISVLALATVLALAHAALPAAGTRLPHKFGGEGRI
jgi:hypothetical protein